MNKKKHIQWAIIPLLLLNIHCGNVENELSSGDSIESSADHLVGRTGTRTPVAIPRQPITVEVAEKRVILVPVEALGIVDRHEEGIDGMEAMTEDEFRTVYGMEAMTEDEFMTIFGLEEFPGKYKVVLGMEAMTEDEFKSILGMEGMTEDEFRTVYGMEAMTEDEFMSIFGIELFKIVLGMEAMTEDE